MIAFLLIWVGFDPLDNDGREIRLYSYVSGMKYTVTIREKALEKAPVWKDDAENPPISARKAMKLAEGLKTRLVQETEDYEWVRASANLEEASPGRWYWLIYYEAHVRKGGMTGIPTTLRLVVLMDGTAIEPEVTKERK